MADVLIVEDLSGIEAESTGPHGQVVNVYSTYANALTHGESGLLAVDTVNELDGVTGVAVTQVARVTGVPINRHNQCIFIIDDANTECYLMCEAGKWGAPRKVVVQ